MALVALAKPSIKEGEAASASARARLAEVRDDLRGVVVEVVGDVRQGDLAGVQVLEGHVDLALRRPRGGRNPEAGMSVSLHSSRKGYSGSVGMDPLMRASLAESGLEQPRGLNELAGRIRALLLL